MSMFGGRAKPGNARQVLVERRHRVPEVRLGTADAGMAAADRPVRAAVPFHVGTVLERDGTLAAHLVEAVAGAVSRVSPRLDVLTGVVVRASLAVVVDRLAVGEQRPPVVIERRPALEREVVHEERREVLDVRRARGQVDEVLDARHRVGDAKRSGWIGRRRRKPAEGRARADGNRGRRVAADLPRNGQGRLAADRAVGAVGARRNRPLDDGDVAAGTLVHGLVAVLLRLVSGGGHDRLVVVERQHVEHGLRQRSDARPAGRTPCFRRNPGTPAR